MPTCIYCRRPDPSCGFNVEHVVPKALGEFKYGLKLKDSECCRDCNQFFGDSFDRFLTRDSAEALLRYRHGLKDPAELKGMFTERVRVRLPQDGSNYGGIYLDFMPPPPGESEPFVTMVPQLGAERKDSKGWDYFTEDELREHPELAERIARECGKLRVVWYDNDGTRERVIALLKERGIPFKGEQETGPPPVLMQGGKVTVEVEHRFDEALARAITKIAFNYFAKMLGTEFALRSGFDAVRQFIRYGLGKAPDFVRPQVGPIVKDKRGGDPPPWHVLTLYWDRDRRAILCRLSLFNYMTYLVRLCPHFSGLWREILCGHHFNLDTMDAHELHRTCIIPPEGRGF